MKNIYTLLIYVYSLSLSAQIQQNINFNNGTVSNSIIEIDSIRFNAGTNQMVVTTTSGGESHSLIDINNVTFSNVTTLTPCSGDITTVTDIDGNVYPVVQIGNQCWTSENLRTTRYNNGSVIPNITENTAWGSLTTPSWCHYENNPSNDATYGKLYNWYTVAAGNMCPTGWHVPSDTEWTILTDFLGGEFDAGGKMKSINDWNLPNTAATNESGFSGLPGGLRVYNGNFDGVGNYGNWWSSTENDTFNATFRYLYYELGVVFRDNYLKQFGFSVRCIRD